MFSSNHGLVICLAIALTIVMLILHTLWKTMEPMILFATAGAIVVGISVAFQVAKDYRAQRKRKD